MLESWIGLCTLSLPGVAHEAPAGMGGVKKGGGTQGPVFLLLSWQPRLLYLRAARGLEQFVPIKVGTKWAVKPGGGHSEKPPAPLSPCQGGCRAACAVPCAHILFPSPCRSTRLKAITGA